MNTAELIAELCREGYMAYAGRREAADLIEQQAARIAELEARCGEPVAYFVNDNQPGMKPHYSQISEAFKHHKDVFAFYTHPPIGDAAGKDSVDAVLYTMDQMREYADNFHLSRMKVLVAEKEAYERHAPTEPTLDQIRKIEDEFGIVWFVPDDSETFAWRTTNTDEHRKFARAVWKAAIASLTKLATGDKP